MVVSSPISPPKIFISKKLQPPVFQWWPPYLCASFSECIEQMVGRRPTNHETSYLELPPPPPPRRNEILYPTPLSSLSPVCMLYFQDGRDTQSPLWTTKESEFGTIRWFSILFSTCFMLAPSTKHPDSSQRRCPDSRPSLVLHMLHVGTQHQPPRLQPEEMSRQQRVSHKYSTLVGLLFIFIFNPSYNF